jgi:hypothetical protein
MVICNRTLEHLDNYKSPLSFRLYEARLSPKLIEPWYNSFQAWLYLSGPFDKNYSIKVLELNRPVIHLIEKWDANLLASRELGNSILEFAPLNLYNSNGQIVFNDEDILALRNKLRE